jgi:hypothetical protein
MKLCLQFSKPNTDDLFKFDTFNDHSASPLECHPCFTALEISALAGCDMCYIFLEGAVEQVCNHQADFVRSAPDIARLRI